MCLGCRSELVLELLDRAMAYSYDKDENLSDVVDEIAYAYDTLCEAVDMQDVEYFEIDDDEYED